jgi:hypothetical protein
LAAACNNIRPSCPPPRIPIFNMMAKIVSEV